MLILDRMTCSQFPFRSPLPLPNTPQCGVDSSCPHHDWQPFHQRLPPPYSRTQSRTAPICPILPSDVSLLATCKHRPSSPSATYTARGILLHPGQATATPIRSHLNPIATPHPPPHR